MGNILATYTLKKTNILTGDVEYFDFTIMQFMHDRANLVPLAAIDSLTSIFLSGQELVNYTEKRTICERDYPFKFEIERQDKLGRVRATYPVVFDDEIISALSKSTDGHVDFTNDSNYTTLCQITNSVSNIKNGLSKWITSSLVPGKRLSNQNNRVIQNIAERDTQPSFGAIMKAFRPYNEFRALYLRYNDYKDKTPVLTGSTKHIQFSPK